MNLEGKTAIVTGSSSGIGAEFSKALVSKGCRVYGLARRAGRLEELRETLGDLFVPTALDITDYDELEDWNQKQFGNSAKSHQNEASGPDILINNAGLGYFGDVDKMEPDKWDTLIQTNLTAIFRLTRLVVPMMKQKNTVSHIVNISSVAGLIGNPGLTAYNATKFGLRGFSEALMKELRNERVKVTCIYPGSIATEFFDDIGGTHANMMRSEDVANTLIHILETPDNFLIDEITLRPLVPKAPGK